MSKGKQTLETWPAIGYVRVSTKEQEKSGLGLDAQRAKLRQFADQNHFDLLEIYEEVETGKGADALDKRPKLLAAMRHARKTKAVLLVSRLDRLSRNVHFISGLMEKQSKVRFVVAELGEEVENFQLHIHAAVAEKERELISQRTKEALARRKAAGKPMGHPEFTTKINKLGNDKMRALADEFARKTYPHIKPHLDVGTSYCQIAKHLQRTGIPTARGGEWQATQVAAIVKRVQSPSRRARA